MSGYPLSWVTSQLAVGHAPMSYEELKAIRDQGIDAIINLCGEYCDLHHIQKDFGFEVYYLPVEDNQAPSLQEVEKALQWLDDAIYLGKKILVHCHLGIGRTGTFVTAYLLRRGFTMKLARRELSKTRAEFTSFAQWWFLRKFGKKQGKLRIREPSLEGGRLVDLSPYFKAYEALVEEAEALFLSCADRHKEPPRCGKDTDACCHRFITLELIEAVYLNRSLNKKLAGGARLEAIHRAIDAHKIACRISPPGRKQASTLLDGEILGEACPVGISEVRDYTCPLSVGKKCIAFPYRPIVCRMYRSDGITPYPSGRMEEKLDDLSKHLFIELNGTVLQGTLLFSLTNIVSGRFVQEYFHFITTAPAAAPPP
ncbi:MAG: dual specificity protein phosphatase family protein [Deltaproteobacteria bacterium]|nr:dual specificity protein phosphatase family protein [Deltaproteobacteria bacterium]